MGGAKNYLGEDVGKPPRMTYAKILKKINGPMLTWEDAGQVIAALLKAEQREYRAERRRLRQAEREERLAWRAEWQKQNQPAPSDTEKAADVVVLDTVGNERLPVSGAPRKYIQPHSATPHEPETFHVLAAAAHEFAGDPGLLRQLRELVSV